VTVGDGTRADAGAVDPTSRNPACCIIPDYVLRRIAENGDYEQRRSALKSLETSVTMRAARAQAEARRSVTPRAPEVSLLALDAPVKERIIRDAQGTADRRGPIVRQEGPDPQLDDPAVNEAFEYLGDTWDFYFEVFARNSIDKAGMPLEAVVHYRQRYDNAVWNGSQMIFGDGSGFKFTRLTQSLTVCAHELTHGVIQYDGPLVYQREAGALNESFADVLGVLVEQRKLGQRPAEADWLIGREIMAPGVTGVDGRPPALRSLKAPGTAYDDDLLGRDMQPAHIDDFVETDIDHGGVHINSGIPNHAFFRLATALDRPAWEDAGRIWYASLGHERLLPTASFRQFARITRQVAGVIFGAGSSQQDALVEAWHDVGVRL
jgi:Zn-dependent metalloprotease